MPVRNYDPNLDFHPFAEQYGPEPDAYVPPQPKTFAEKWTNRRQSNRFEDHRRGPLTAEEERQALLAQIGTSALALPATAANILNPWRTGTPSEEFDAAQEQVGTPMYATVTGDDPRRVAELMARRRYERTPRAVQEQLWRAAPARLDNQPPAPPNVVTAQPVQIARTELRPSILPPAPPRRPAGGMGRGRIVAAPDGFDPFGPMDAGVGNTTAVASASPNGVELTPPYTPRTPEDMEANNRRIRERLIQTMARRRAAENSDEVARRSRGLAGDPLSRQTWDAGRPQRVAEARSRGGAPAQQQAMALPPVGTVVEGWRYLGGDPHDRNSWSR